MFNIKWGLIAGGAAFLFSLLVGALNGVALGPMFFRAGIFAVVFFAAGIGAYVMVHNFLPELLYTESPEDNDTDTLSTLDGEQTGRRVNITLGGALPEMYRHTDNSTEVGNIVDLMNSPVNPEPEAGAAGQEDGMDQTAQDGYTDEGRTGSEDFNQDNMDFTAPGPDKKAVFEPSPVFKGPVFTASVVNEEGGLGGLPDLDAMAGAFSTGEGGEDEFMGGESSVSAPARHPGSKKPEGFQGDFNPKELAEGIRTVLSKDK